MEYNEYIQDLLCFDDMGTTGSLADIHEIKSDIRSRRFNNAYGNSYYAIAFGVLACFCDLQKKTPDMDYRNGMEADMWSDQDIQNIIDDDPFFKMTVDRIYKWLDMNTGSRVYRGLKFTRAVWNQFEHLDNAGLIRVLGNLGKEYNSYSLDPNVAASFAKIAYKNGVFTPDPVWHDGAHIVLSGIAKEGTILYPKTAYMQAKYGNEAEMQIGSSISLDDPKIEYLKVY
ncbi:MAG: hypothetical protein MJZ25_08900 [Fibrobacter sp.]|nr:hypothetical protein [Fibrobacter sp.]